MNEAIQINAIVTFNEMRHILGDVSRTTLYDYIRAGHLPARVVIANRKKGWLREDVSNWMGNLKHER